MRRDAGVCCPGITVKMQMRYGRDRKETGSHQILYASLLLQLFLVSLLPCHMSILYCPQQLHLDVKALGKRLQSMAPYNITVRGQWNNYPMLPTPRPVQRGAGSRVHLPQQSQKQAYHYNAPFQQCPPSISWSVPITHTLTNLPAGRITPVFTHPLYSHTNYPHASTCTVITLAIMGGNDLLINTIQYSSYSIRIT